MSSWKIFCFLPQKCALDALLGCYRYWKYNFIICVLGIAGIKVSSNRRLLTPLFHTPLQFLIIPKDAGCHGSLKPSDGVSWQCCGVPVRRTAHTRLPQPSVLQEVNGSSPGHAGAGGGKPLWSKVMCRDWNFLVIYISMAAAEALYTVLIAEAPIRAKGCRRSSNINEKNL